MEFGKDPSLGVRSLHAAGVDGRGIAIAIIDHDLQPGHQEYRERIKLYDTTFAIGEPSMHGPAVASIAVGKTVGVVGGPVARLVGNLRRPGRGTAG